jgi:quercetin dioxygenase-like cupin family protein
MYWGTAAMSIIALYCSHGLSGNVIAKGGDVVKLRARVLGIIIGIAACTVAADGAEREPQKAVREEYKGPKDRTTVLRDDLVVIPGKEVNILRVEFPAGLIGERHYHTGDVFVHVLEGEFVVDVDGKGRKAFGPGQVYHEAVNKVMQARNPSTTQRTKVILFQVGDKGEPLMIKAK